MRSKQVPTPKQNVVHLSKVRDTKNTVRYEAQIGAMGSAYVSTLYITKEGVDAMGLGDEVVLTITNAAV